MHSTLILQGDYNSIEKDHYNESTYLCRLYKEVPVELALLTRCAVVHVVHTGTCEVTWCTPVIKCPVEIVAVVHIVPVTESRGKRTVV